MAPVQRLAVPVLVIALLLPVALSFATTVSAGDDLYIESVKILQVVPDPRGVVVNKSAAIRLTVVNEFGTEVRADIRVIYNHSSSSYLETGPDGDGVPLAPGVNTVYIPGGNCTAHPMNWTSDPPALVWTHPGPDPDVTAEIDPDDSVAETDETNNERTTDSPLDVYASRSLRILVVPMLQASRRSYYDMYPFEFSLDEELQELRETYPLADDGIEVVEAPPRYDNFDTALTSTCRAVTMNLSAEARMLGYDRVVAVFTIIEDRWGIETYGSAVGVLQEPRDPVPLFVTASGVDARESLLAHELGHTYYLWHPHDIGMRVYNATKWAVGEREYGVSANTLMSYPERSRLPAEVPLTPRWIDEERYQNHTKSWIDLTSRYTSGPEGTYEWNLFSQLVFTPPTLGSIVVISGSVLQDGTVLLPRPWFSIPQGVMEQQIIPQQGPVGSYSVRMLDSLRGVLGTTYFNASFTRLTHYEGAMDSYAEEEVDRADFVVSAENMPGTRYVQILDPLENVLAEKEVSPSMPTVEVLSPDGAQNIAIGQSIEISWMAGDLDGDDLSYFVSYTPDDGGSWIPIAGDLTATSCVWNTTGIAPTDECRVRVMASDGFNTGEDVSDTPFKMVDIAPPTTRMELEGALGQNGWYVSGVNVSLIAIDNSRILETEYSFDNSSWTIYNPHLCLVDEGSRTIYYRSEDLAGNVEPVRSGVVRIDSTAPSLSITSPVNGSSVAEGVVFSWSASDGVSGVARYEVRLNAGAWTDMGTAQEWETVGLVRGTNTFEVRAADVAGNGVTVSVEFSCAEPSGIALWMLALIIGAVIAVGVVIGVYYFRRVES